MKKTSASSYILPFCYGILAAFFALVLEQIALILTGEILNAVIMFNITWLILTAALIEEITKYALIYKNFQIATTKTSTIIGSILIGLGFAGVEIYFNLSGMAGSWKQSTLPLLGITFVHLLTSGFAGSVLSKKHNFYASTARILLFNTLLHIIYNFAVLNIF